MRITWLNSATPIEMKSGFGTTPVGISHVCTEEWHHVSPECIECGEAGGRPLSHSRDIGLVVEAGSRGCAGRERSLDKIDNCGETVSFGFQGQASRFTHCCRSIIGESFAQPSEDHGECCPWYSSRASTKSFKLLAGWSFAVKTGAVVKQFLLFNGCLLFQRR
jgi:hypothetical protein